jgi:hypothetical protein
MQLTLLSLFARKIYAFRVVVLVYRRKPHISYCLLLGDALLHWFLASMCQFARKSYTFHISHCYVGLQEKATHLVLLHWFFV